MALKHASVIALQPLVNGFHQLTLESDSFINAQPGLYVLIEQQLQCYIMSQNNCHADFIIPPDPNFQFNTKSVSISELLGKPLVPPDPKDFYLFLTNLKTLGASLFYFKKFKHLFKGLVILETDDLFPFYPTPSRKMIPFIPPEVIASLPLLEDWGIPNRLASPQDRPGCFNGSADDLATLWLKQFPHDTIQKIVLY